jgi:hypothetical protein
VLERRVELSLPVRVALALVVAIGGSAFFLVGVTFLVRAAPAIYPLGAAVLSIVLAALGLGMLWLGLRLLRVRAASSSVLGSIARRRTSLVVGVLALCEFAVALQLRSPEHLLGSAWLVVFSYFLFPLGS